MESSGVIKRILFIVGFLLLALCADTFQLTRLHLGDHSEKSRRFIKRIMALRGRVLDRNEKEMIVSQPAWQVYIDPQSVRTNHQVDALSKLIATNLNLDIGFVKREFNREDTQYIKMGITQDLNFDNYIQSTNVSGIGVDETAIRNYPQGRTMSHVIGYIVEDSDKREGAGIEKYFDDFLKGTDGQIVSERTGGRKSREIFERRKRDVPSIAGHDIYLTLDCNLQEAVEEKLKATVEEFKAQRGWSIIQKVKTGEILAMANYPDFDPKHPKNDDPLLNYAVSAAYEPGSVMKSVTVSAFLNEKLGNPRSTFDAMQGSWFYGGAVLHDHATGIIDIATALKKSSNIVCAKLALRLGNDRFYRYIRAFNLGSRFGVDLPGERRGFVLNPKKWYQLTPTRVAIGQGVTVTALQMVSVYSCIANDGMMMKPYVVDRIVSATGEEIKKNKPEMIGRPISPKVAQDMRRMLRGVTEMGGTGRRAAMHGYSVGGKTGTSQKVIGGRYSSTDYLATFIGFVPVEHPVFTVLVTIDTPQPQHSGGFVAAPAFREIAKFTAQYLEVPPDLPMDEEDEKKADTPPAIGILTDPDLMSENPIEVNGEAPLTPVSEEDDDDDDTEGGKNEE